MRAVVTIRLMRGLLVILVLAAACGAAAEEGPAAVRFAVLGDRTGTHEPGIHGQIIAEIERLRPDFVIGVGDMIEGYSQDTTAVKKEWAEYEDLIDGLTMPVHLIPGNHDIWDDASEVLFRRRIGMPYYSFDEGGIHFIVLDTSRYPTVDDFPDDQVQWLIDDLEGHRDAAYTIAVFHIPYWIETVAEGEPDRFHAVFVEYGVDAVFTGHYHVYFSGRFDGILYTSIGSSGGGCEPGLTGLKYHYAWVTVDGDGISVAPIRMGSVLPWDEVTASDFKFVDRVTDEALSLEKIQVGIEAYIPETPFTVTIENLDTLSTLRGTVEWSMPSGWTVRPKELPIDIAAGRTYDARFRVESTAPLYPVPELSLEYPYAEGKTFEVTRALALERMVEALRADEAPVIDGELNEAIWTEPTTEFFAPDGSARITDPVSFYFAWDDANLYLAAYCEESEMDSLVAAASEHDAAIYGEDCVGYFLQPDVNDGPVYQIYFNPLGTAFDQIIEVEGGRYTRADPEWNGTYEVKTRRGEDFWSIEIRVPLDQLGVRGQYEGIWALNFRRKQRRLGTAADWQVPIGYDPLGYGKLVMR
jgi:hypothetical protein